MWKRNVYLYYLWSGVSVFWLLTAVLIPFYKSKGLNQFEIQTIQAVFQLAIFGLEVPTGIIADRWGRKISLVLGSGLMMLGLLLYPVGYGFWWFAGCEVLLALGYTLKSGSNQALLYDSLKQFGQEHSFAKILSINKVITLTGIMLGAGLGSFLTGWLSLDQITWVNGLIMGLATVISLFLKEPVIYQEQEVVRLSKIVKEGLGTIKNNSYLQWMFVSGGWLYSLGYFVIWLYQVKLNHIEVPMKYFGLFHVMLVLVQIMWFGVWNKIVRITGEVSYLMGTLLLASTGYVLAGLNQSVMGVVVWFVLSGMLGLTIPEIISVFSQKHINSKVRASVISAFGMIKGLMIAVMNPIIGWMVDQSLNKGLIIVGIGGVVGTLLLWMKKPVIYERKV